ncbi:hypothetical protein CJU89_5800 [Yarrowia sp. B02]|nr:hypothetical protein CJU89_5800 [Yarrowia sp. B02]
MELHTRKLWATPSKADILLLAIASAKLTEPVLFHKTVHKWLTRPVNRTFLPLPCPPTHATFAVDRFISDAPNGYRAYDPRHKVNHILHRYLSAAISEVRGQLKCGNTASAMNLWRFCLDECLKRYAENPKNIKAKLSLRLCKRLDALVVRLPSKNMEMLVLCIEHLIALLSTDLSANEERLVATYLYAPLPPLTEHLGKSPAPAGLEATLRSALRWIKAYF